MRAAGLERVPVIVGGIIPPADAERLRAAGVAAVYTPKDFEINTMLGAIVRRSSGVTIGARRLKAPRDLGQAGAGALSRGR